MAGGVCRFEDVRNDNKGGIMNKKLVLALGALVLLGVPEVAYAQRRFAGGAALGFMAGRSGRRRSKTVIYQQPGPYYRDVIEHDQELKREVEELREENARLKRRMGAGRGPGSHHARRRRRKH